MTNRHPGTNNPNAAGNPVKDPEDWTTGDEPMDETLTKAQASERMAELQQRTGRATAPGEKTGRRSAR
jgi:hypothetical protein